MSLLSLSLSLRLAFPFPSATSPRGCRTNILDKHVMSGAVAAVAATGAGEREGEGAGRERPEAPRSSFNFLAKNKFAWPDGAYGPASGL